MTAGETLDTAQKHCGMTVGETLDALALSAVGCRWLKKYGRLSVD